MNVLPSAVWLVWGLGLALVGTVEARPWPEPPEAPFDDGLVARTVVPDLIALREASEARRTLIAAARRGEIGLAEALPEVPDVGDPVALRARLRALDRVGVERARSVEALALAGLGDRTEKRLSTARLGAATAQAAADEAERALLFEVLAVAEAHPAFRPGAVVAARAPLDAARAELVASKDPQALDRVAELDQARARWTRLLARARQVLWSGGTLDIDPELAAIGGDDELLARDAIARLDVVRPALTVEVRRTTDDLIASWIEANPVDRGAPDASLPIDLSSRDAARAEAETALERAAAWAAAPVLPEDVSPQRRAAVEDAATDEVGWWAARVAALTEAARTEAVARAEREAARRAAEIAETPSDDPVARIEQESVSWTAHAWAAVAAWREASLEARASLDDALSALEEETASAVAAAADAGWLSEGPGVDEVYLRARERLVEIRASLLDHPPRVANALEGVPPRPDGRRLDVLKEAAQEARDLADPAKQAEALAGVALARSAIEAEEEPLEDVERLVDQEMASRREALRRIRSVRHDLRDHAGRAARDVDLAALVPDLRAEIRTMPSELLAVAASRLDRARRLGRLMLDGRMMRAAIVDVVWTLLALVLWWLTRGRLKEVASRLAGLGSDDSHRAQVASRERAEAIEPLLRHLLDAVVAWWIALAADDVLAELGVLVRTLGVASLWRAGVAAALLAVVTPGGRRGAAFIVSEEGLGVLRRSLHTLGVVAVLRYFLPRVLADVLYADVLGMLAGRAVDVVGAVVLAVVLARWAPRLRSRVEPMRNNPAWVTFWLRRRGATDRLLAPLTAVVLLAYLGGAAAWDVLQRRAARQDAARSVLALVDRIRQRMDVEEEEEPYGEPIGPALRGRLCGPPQSDAGVLPREEAHEVLGRFVAAWSDEARRGLLVLTGDKGDGKRVFLDTAMHRLTEQGRVVVRGEIHDRIETVEGMVAWLADALSLPGVPESVEALRREIGRLPPRIIMIRRAERAFVRRVNGFEAFRTLLATCNATGDRHLWMLSVHRPAWSYLTRLGGLVNTGVVRGVVDLPPLRPDGLRELVMRRTNAAGLEVSFHRLEDTGPFGAPPEVEHRRAVDTYFRLLADASGGCPHIALHLWAASLRAAGSGRLDVVVPPEFAVVPPSDLRPEELFVLAALRLQERLDLEELEEQAVVEDDDVEAIVRGLEQRGLVVVEGQNVSLATRHVVSVTRMLRRRHFLQWAV